MINEQFSLFLDNQREFAPQSERKSIGSLNDRYTFLLSLKPRNIIIDTNNFDNYFGAKFSDNLVIFENLEYGNAIYVMFKNWESLSKHSRKELLGRYIEGKDFIRIVHTKGWKKKLEELIGHYSEKDTLKKKRRAHNVQARH